MKGLHASIYRNAMFNGCALDGLSSKVNHVTVIDPALPGISEPDAEHPAVRLVRRNLFGRIYVHAEPIDPEYHGGKWLMMGGTYICTSDSRFHDAVDNGRYPVSLHDRHERASG